MDVDNFEEIDVVKRYFQREFTVLSREIREKVQKLDIPEEEKQEYLKALAFLSREKQLANIKLLESLYNRLKDQDLL